jgi:hypothetical protein
VNGGEGVTATCLMDIERYGAKLYADTYCEPKDRSICQCIRDLTLDTHQHLPEGISPLFFLLLLAPSSTERPPKIRPVPPDRGSWKSARGISGSLRRLDILSPSNGLKIPYKPCAITTITEHEFSKSDPRKAPSRWPSTLWAQRRRCVSRYHIRLYLHAC